MYPSQWPEDHPALLELARPGIEVERLKEARKQELLREIGSPAPGWFGTVVALAKRTLSVRSARQQGAPRRPAVPDM